MARKLLISCRRGSMVIAMIGAAVAHGSGTADAALVADYNFVQTTAGPVADGQASGSTPFGSAELLDDVTGTDGRFQFNTWDGSIGPAANYALEGQSLPPRPETNPPGWDGAGLAVNGDLFIRAVDSTLELTGPFSVFARVYHQQGPNETLTGPDPRQTVFGGANIGANGAWNVFLNNIVPNNDFDRLEVQMGSTASGSSEAMRNGFNGNGPQIYFNQWVDIGISFDGDADASAGNNDEANETLKVYVNGTNDVRTITGSAAFATNIGGVFAAIFGDGFGNTPFVGQYERFAIWDEVLSDQQFDALSLTDAHVPEPSTFTFMSLAATVLGVRVCRRRRPRATRGDFKD